MIRCCHRIVNLKLLSSLGSPGEHPIDRSAPFEQGVRWCCWDKLILWYQVELGSPERIGSRSTTNVQVEVTRQDDPRVRFVAASIIKALIELGAAQIVVAAALKVQVVSHQCSASNTHVAHQGHPAADPLLEWRNFGNKPARAPEARLPLKAEYAGMRQRPARKRGLPMVGRRCPRALCQLLELTPKNIVHFKLLRDLSRNIDLVRSAGVKVDLLQDDHIGLRAGKEFDDPNQPQAPINVPVDNPD